MTVKVGINGFGRIGRQVLKAMKEKYRDEFDVVAVNDRRAHTRTDEGEVVSAGDVEIAADIEVVERRACDGVCADGEVDGVGLGVCVGRVNGGPQLSDVRYIEDRGRDAGLKLFDKQCAMNAIARFHG